MRINCRRGVEVRNGPFAINYALSSYNKNMQTLTIRNTEIHLQTDRAGSSMRSGRARAIRNQD